MCSPAAIAKWGTFKITDDSGDEVMVHHGLFGKKTVVKDRNGDGFSHSRSIFGLTKDTQAGALGNDIHVHKGLFGFGKTEGQDMLGDTVNSKSNPLFRNTNIDLSGANNMVSKFFGKHKPVVPNNFSPPVPQSESLPSASSNPSAPLADPNAFASPTNSPVLH